jgi:glycosyl transferase family 25
MKNYLIIILILFFILLLLQNNKEKFTNHFKIDKIIFINLEHRIDRKIQITFELDRFNLLNYDHFLAISNKNGAIGCAKSHLTVLKNAKEKGYKNLLILEDDFEFIVDKKTFNDEINKLNNVKFDVCLLAYNTPNLYESEYPFLYKIKNAQTTSAYIIQSHYYDTLINQWEEGLKKLEETNLNYKFACDITWKELQNKDNWFCFKIRIGKQREGYSDIEKKIVNYNV